MSSAIAPINQSFSEEQIEIIRSQVAPRGTTNDELALFLMYCNRTGLDPFTRQIYLSERRSQDPQTGNWVVSRKPETTVDGFRLIAERTGQYAGQEGPYWCGDDGQWRDVWLSSEPPRAAKVGILRHDFKEPLWAVALYDEYVQAKKDGQPNSMWKKMPANQLAKCAESLGHRRAFPRELSGLYTREEMPDQQAEQRNALEDIKARKIAEAQAELSKLRQIPEGSTLSPAEVAMLMEQGPKPRLVDSKRTKKTKGPISYKALESFGIIKKELNKLTDSDEKYYSILGQFGYKHANEIPDNDVAATVYKALAMANTTAKQDAGLLQTFTDIQSALLGSKEFYRILGAHGCENIQDAMKLNGTPFGALMAELNQAVGDRKRMQEQPQ